MAGLEEIKPHFGETEDYKVIIGTSYSNVQLDVNDFDELGEGEPAYVAVVNEESAEVFYSDTFSEESIEEIVDNALDREGFEGETVLTLDDGTIEETFKELYDGGTEHVESVNREVGDTSPSLGPQALK